MKKETFESSLLQLALNRDPRQVFIDFLTVTISSFTQNHSVPLSMETFSRYAAPEIKYIFPRILTTLIREINERANSESGNDVIGEFYQTHFLNTDAGKKFMPWADCVMMARFTVLDQEIIAKHWPIAILDVGCGSGRVLLTSARRNGFRYEYLGVDTESVCVMMTTLNLFFNCVTNTEVVWVDANNPNAFKESYRITLFPHRIIRILDREKSKAWMEYQIYAKAQNKGERAQG